MELAWAATRVPPETLTPELAVRFAPAPMVIEPPLTISSAPAVIPPAKSFWRNRGRIALRTP